jgi:paraquat-inducible protein B
LQNKLNTIVAKVEKMSLENIGTDVKKLLATIDSLLKRIDGETLPEIKKTLEDLKQVLKSADANLVGKDAPTQQQLRETLQELNRAAKGVSGLTEYLERNPEALIKGKTQEKP